MRNINTMRGKRVLLRLIGEGKFHHVGGYGVKLKLSMRDS